MEKFTLAFVLRYWCAGPGYLGHGSLPRPRLVNKKCLVIILALWVCVFIYLFGRRVEALPRPGAEM